MQLPSGMVYVVNSLKDLMSNIVSIVGFLLIHLVDFIGIRVSHEPALTPTFLGQKISPLFVRMVA